MGKILDKICDYLKQYLKKYNDKKTSKVSYLIRVSLNQAVEIIGKERIYFCWNYENEDLENRLNQIAFDFKLNKTNNIFNCSDEIIDELRNKNIITIKNRKYDNEDFSEVSKFIKDIKKYFHQNLKENIINNEYSKKMIDINTAEEVIKIREDIAKIDNKSNKENKQSKELIKSIGVLSIGEPICKKDIINDCEYKWDLTEFFDRKLYKKWVTWVNIQNKLDEYIKEIKAKNILLD